MTWAEFRIRLHSWIRQSEREVFLIRELAWIVYIAPHNDPKKLKKTREQFWPLKKGGEKKVTDSMLKRIKEAQKKYHDDIKK